MAAARTKKAATPRARKTSAKASTPRQSTAPVAPPPAPERDFLVIYEEDDEGLPGDDHLVLDIESPQSPSRGELDVKQRLDLELSNTTSQKGTMGFILTCIGAVLGLGLIAFFLASYPDQWYNQANGALVRGGPIKPTLLVGIVTILVLLVGTILTHYGRRIQARGNLSQVRIVEKTSQNKAQLR